MDGRMKKRLDAVTKGRRERWMSKERRIKEGKIQS